MADGIHATIPIFPLADVVLFPKLRVPLHIFEPRYRQMTQEALAGDRRIGMVTVRPEHIHATAGDPAVFATGCEGAIVESESLPDGSYNIVLLGTHRFEIRSEHSPGADRLYRIAEVELLAEAPAPGGTPSAPVGDTEEKPAQTRTAIIQRLHLLRQHTRPEPVDSASSLASTGSTINAELFEAYDDELFVNSLAQSLSFSATEKQGLIECASVSKRLQHLVALLQFKLAAIRSGQSGATSLQ